MKKSSLFRVAYVATIVIQILLAVVLVWSLWFTVTLDASLYNASVGLPAHIATAAQFILHFTVFAGLILMLFPVRTLVWEIHQGPSPFVAGNVKKLKRISLILLVVFFVIIGLRILEVAFTATYIYQPEPVEYVMIQNFGFSLDMTPFVLPVLAFVVYCIALVFEYGIVLQTESDETL